MRKRIEASRVYVHQMGVEKQLRREALLVTSVLRNFQTAVEARRRGLAVVGTLALGEAARRIAGVHQTK